LPSFSQSQAASDGSRGFPLVYFPFNVLHLDGHHIASLPLIERKALLERLVAAISNFVQLPRGGRRRADPKARRATWA
jgi:ATP-dependent DNA ligase